jgi:two-component system chemotaxis response regulator CheY
MKKRILLLEDEPGNQRMLDFVLHDLYDLQFVQNGYEAIRWLEKNQLPDLIIMDWVMPIMDGKTFLKTIKVSGQFFRIPVIVLSSNDDITEELASIPFHAQGQLMKPIDGRLLKDTIEDVLAMRLFATYSASL